MSVPGLGHDHISHPGINVHKQEFLRSAGLAKNCNGWDKKPNGE
jgi:hypothetical protein